jgi:membrane protein
VPERDPGRGRRVWLYTVFVMRRWLVEDRAGGLAAILTIDTLLSMVPVLGLTLIGVSMMDPDSGAALLQNIFRSLVPETSRAEGMAVWVLESGRNVSVARLGGLGFILALGIAFILFSALEKTFNRIWRVRRTRNVFVKFTMFYTIATLGPLVILYSLAQPLLSEVSAAFTSPIVTTSIGLILLNRLMPYTKVSWRAAVIGGVLSAALIELGKMVFGLYLTRVALDTYEGLYGPLAVIPILVIWWFLSWMVVLLGAEVAFVVQHRRAIALLGYLNPHVRTDDRLQGASGRTAARLLLAICDSYDRSGAGVAAVDLAERFELTLDRVGEILSHLEQRGLVLEAERPTAGYVPARLLDQIKVGDVLAAFEHEISQRVRDDRLSQVFVELDRAREQVVGDLTYQHLVELRREPRTAAKSDDD